MNSIRWVGVALALAGLPFSAAAGGLELRVDLREAPRGLLHATLRIPAQPGPMTLLYPHWIPGQHAAVGPVNDLAGLHLTADGQPLAWRRDPVNLYALHLDVPAGVSSVEATYDYLGATASGSPDVMAQKVTSSQLPSWRSWNGTWSRCFRRRRPRTASRSRPRSSCRRDGRSGLR